MIMSYLFSECRWGGGCLHHCDIAIWPLLSRTFTQCPKTRCTKASHSHVDIHTSGWLLPMRGTSRPIGGQFRVRRKCPCPEETRTCGHLKHTKHGQTDREGGGLVGKPNTQQQQQQQDGRQIPNPPPRAHSHRKTEAWRRKKGQEREESEKERSGGEGLGGGEVVQGRRTREERNSVMKGEKKGGGDEWRPGERNGGLD